MFRGSHHDIGRNLVFLIEKLPVYEQITAHIGENFAFNCAYDDKFLSVVITKVTNEVICDDISAIIIVTDITKEKLIEKQKRISLPMLLTSSKHRSRLCRALPRC